MISRAASFAGIVLAATCVGQLSAAEWIEVYTKEPGAENWTYRHSWLEEPGLPPAREVAAEWVKRNVKEGTQVRINSRTIEPVTHDEAPTPKQPGETAPATPPPTTPDDPAPSQPAPSPDSPAPTQPAPEGPNPDSEQPAPDSAEPGTTVMTLDQYLPLLGNRISDEAGEGVLPKPEMIADLRRIWEERSNLKKKRSDLEQFYDSTAGVEANKRIKESNDAKSELDERQSKLKKEEGDVQQQRSKLEAQISDQATESELEAIGKQLAALKERQTKLEDRKDKFQKDTKAWELKRKKLEPEIRKQQKAIESATPQAVEYNENAKRHSDDLNKPWLKKAVEELERALGAVFK